MAPLTGLHDYKKPHSVRAFAVQYNQQRTMQQRYTGYNKKHHQSENYGISLILLYNYVL